VTLVIDGFSQRSLNVLEFHRVCEALADRAATGMGRELAVHLVPSASHADVRRKLDQVEDALFGVALSLGGITDVRPILKRLDDGQTVPGSDLLEVAHTLDSAMTLKRSVAQHSMGPLLEVATRIGQHVILCRTVLERLDRDGTVRDDATPKLRHIRRRLQPLRSEIRDRLSNLMDRNAEAMQDKLITIRRDRYVIPVRASMENQVPGIVVDSSASNQTVFIEPASVVPLNNELAKLMIEEEQEVTRILLELARMVMDEPGLIETLAACAELDLVAAKAALAREWDLNRPEIAERGEVWLEDLRHPLVENCVPNDLKLDAKRRILLITGPNMGGKTVTLKSLGLAAIMMQSGLYVRARIAKLPVLEDVLVDVGDEQSITQSLSTFAAHLKNLNHILERASQDTLVLIDELGSGTDPAEGAALSQAILEGLLERGARGIVTSHLSPLKVFAFEREDVTNASMGFSLERLMPTFKLIVGQPGRSYALSIARRLGLPADVLDRASSVLGPEGANVEKLLENLERERETLARDAATAREARAQAEREALEMREKLEQFERDRIALMQEARDRAEGIYRDAFEQVRQAKQRAKDEFERPKVLNELRELRRQVQAERPEVSAVVREADPLKPGASVEVPAYGASGTVLELRGDDVIVQLGLLKVTLKRRDLKLKRASTEQRQKFSSGGALSVRSDFERELNLRGSSVEEAVEQVRGFIAEAHALRESPIRLLHGKGEGVLRRVLRDYLKTDKRVESFMDAPPNEGGHGVTIASLRV
jgi:DNA mismatch repair protein MutS2